MTISFAGVGWKRRILYKHSRQSHTWAHTQITPRWIIAKVTLRDEFLKHKIHIINTLIKLLKAIKYSTRSALRVLVTVKVTLLEMCISNALNFEQIWHTLNKIFNVRYVYTSTFFIMETQLTDYMTKCLHFLINADKYYLPSLETRRETPKIHVYPIFPS